jgi:CubicO group peptidase (beta-lactamase class C family)
VRLILAVPRLPVLPDPLRRVRIAADLGAVTTVGAEDDPRDAGLDPEAVGRIWGAVRGVYRSGVHPAIALCLRREGRVVIDRAIGHARGNGPHDGRDVERVLATPETPFGIFSASKAVTAMVVHLLDQRGLIHIGDRVCEYIPEFARHGKDAITIAHVLAHRAGIPNVPPVLLDLDSLSQGDVLLEAMCEARLQSRPGKALAYHAIGGGFILGEIVRRVTGRDIREVLAAEILEPLSFRWGNYGVRPQDIPRVALSYPTGAPVLPPLSGLLERALGAPVDRITQMSNDPRFLTAIVPAGNVVTTANELARFFELLRCGGELDGVRIFEPRTIRRALTEQSHLELDLTLGFPNRYALGFVLGARRLSLYGPNTELAFGHLGFTNVIGWSDPERALSGALITSGKPVVYPELPQLWNIMRRIGTEAPRIPRDGQRGE